MDRYYLYPGQVFASRKPHMVDTILGSCIAVTLWDKVLKFGAINHYMLPVWNGEGKATCRYGNIALAEMIKQMISLGSNIAHIQAKIFGGGEISSLNGVFNIGKRNSLFAREYLTKQHISVVSISIGGSLGRKVIFNTFTGEVLIKVIKKRIGTIDQINSDGINSKA